MRYLYIILLLFVVKQSSAQIKTVRIPDKEVPAYIKHKGKIDTALRYTDKDGDHILVTSVEWSKPDKEDFRHVYLYAYNYLIKGSSVTLQWQMVDMVDDCSLDIVAEFVGNALTVTDLDNNGIAEVWLMYRTACHGDVSPSILKVIMHEGAKKYAMRGESKVVMGSKEVYGGNYKFDDAFNTAAESFKIFARNLWKKYVVERNG